MRQVKLLYFKSYGKYYSEGSYATQKEYDFDVYTEVENMFLIGSYPGLYNTGKPHEFDCVIFPENGVPGILYAKEIQNLFKMING